MSTAWRNTLAYMPAVLMAAGIAVVSLWENPQAPLLREVSDKTLHALLYGLWMTVIMAGVIYRRHTRPAVYAAVCVVAIVYGAILELLQATCTHTRSGEWADAAADAAGVIIGFLLMWGIYQLTRNRY